MNGCSLLLWFRYEVDYFDYKRLSQSRTKKFPVVPNSRAIFGTGARMWGSHPSFVRERIAMLSQWEESILHSLAASLKKKTPSRRPLSSCIGCN